MKILRTSAIAAGLLVLGIGGGLLVNRAASYANTRIETQLNEKAPAPEKAEPVQDPVFVDWFALGSGCRARPTEAGDVEIEHLPIFRTDPLRHSVRFHMPKYQLALEGAAGEPADAADSGARTAGARQCAIRLAVTPARGFRIHDVRAHTRVVVRRGVDSELRVIEELKHGNDPIAASRSPYAAGMGPGDIDTEVHLGTDLPNGTRPSETPCSEPKLVVYDFTWIGKLGASGEPIRVDLGGDKTLDVDVIMEPCTDVDAGAPPQGESR
jgi:hypothetical protein